MIICIAYCHRLPVVQAEPFKKVISKAISHLTKQVQNAKALIDGVLFLDGMDNTLEGPHNVEFLVPFKNNLPAEGALANAISYYM
jgi:bacterioferritin (cytochrome b1)